MEDNNKNDKQEQINDESLEKSEKDKKKSDRSKFVNDFVKGFAYGALFQRF